VIEVNMPRPATSGAPVLIRALLVVLILGATSTIVARAKQPGEVPPRAPFSSFPIRAGGWQGVENPPFDRAVLDMSGVDEHVNRTYYEGTGRARAAVGLYIGYYASQAQGDTIHSPLNCLPGLGWEPVSRDVLAITVPGASGPPIEVNRYVVQKQHERHVVLYWYQGRGRVIANEYWSKLWLMVDAVRSGRTDAALVRVIAPVRGGGPDAVRDAEQTAAQFVREMVPHLDSYLPR
jgi:EpsI family protein